FSSRRRHTRSYGDWSSDVCSSDLICGFVATITALGWTRAELGRRVHGIRVVVLILAVTTVILGWPLERKVSELRHARNDASDRLLDTVKTAAPASSVQQARDDAAAVRAE